MRNIQDYTDPMATRAYALAALLNSFAKVLVALTGFVGLLSTLFR